ncbi:MAG: O-antigen ligase family protein [bacterium]|nr:O-antigen ligase family protein [bacterium]
MKHFKTLRQPINIVFLIQVVVVFLVAFGVWPRVLILPLTALIAIFILRADLETSTAFFIRSVPIFVAIPFTSYFDSFNIWRIASGLIFLKWFYTNQRSSGNSFVSAVEQNYVPRGLMGKIRKYPLASLLILFILFSLLSLLVANDFFAGIKRIIYLINLGFVPLVTYDLVKKNHELAKKFLGNVLISGVIVAGAGLAQLFTAYLMDLYAFLGFWGDTVQLGFYGSQWARIAVEGNTWFAYFGTQLSLRLFSTFTDSHSFPVYLLMTIPALLALALHKVFTQTDQRPRGDVHRLSAPQQTSSRDFKKLIHIRASWLILLLPVFYLLAILSGTRGIWLAILGSLLALPFLIKKTKQVEGKNILKYLGLLLLPFLILFSVAFPIMGSDQFGLQKGDNQILGRRIRSIIDLEETSNSGRVEIWKKTAESIIHRPLLGVGIGNFPTVLSQHTDLAKAGSSAHNLYLHIAAEIGLIGLLVALGILTIILSRARTVFWQIPDSFLKIYSAAFILYSLWFLFYSLTDAILFDERVFLVFAINSAIILGLYKTKSAVAD